jgi:predicted porin
MNMKKSTLAAIPFLAVGVSSAHAQSSVTISGLLDIGIIHNSNPSQTQIARGNNNRITFSGVEDLGNGLAATFGLQNRFEPQTGTLESPSNGTTRPFWQGESRVGLRSAQYGWIRFGRGLTAIQDPNGAYDPYGVATVASLQGILTAGFNSDPLQSNGAGGGRINNGIFYQSPNLKGVVIRGSYGLTNNMPGYLYRHTGVSAEYQSGGVAAMAGWERNSVGNSLIEIASKYNFGPATGYLGVSRQNVTNSEQARTGIAAGARIPINYFTIKLGAGVLHTSALTNGVSPNDMVIGAGVDFNLSKRTYLYTDFAHTRTSGVSKNSADLGIETIF